MKVCTDACVFGAWVAKKLQDNSDKKLILDIGTGTGLLTLMLAQKINTAFTAVEIDEQAFDQAKQNFLESKWKNNISIFHSDITTFETSQKFDIIISNPPFYENDLKSFRHAINQARHDSSLTLSQLLETSLRLLTTNGAIALLLPYKRLNELQTVATEKDLHISDLLLMKQTVAHDYFRIGAILQKQPGHTVNETITIKDANQHYTPEFIALLKDYYLYL